MLNPSASAFVPYDPRIPGMARPQQSRLGQGQPPPLQPLQQPPGIYYSNGAPQQAHLIDATSLATGVSMPVYVTTPTLTPMQTGIPPPTPTFTLTPSSPSIPNPMTNMPHLVLQTPYFPTPSPHGVLPPMGLGTSPLVTGLPGTPNLMGSVPPQLFSSPAFSTVAIASPLASHMPAPPINHLHLGSAAFPTHTSPRVHQTSFGSSVVGSRTGRQILTTPPPASENSPKLSHISNNPHRGPHAPDTSANERRSKKSNGKKQNHDQRTPPGKSQRGKKRKSNGHSLPPPMLSDEVSVPRMTQIQPQPQFINFPPTPPMVAIPMNMAPFMAQQVPQLVMLNAQYQPVQGQMSQTDASVLQAMQQAGPTHATMSTMPNGLMPQQLVPSNGVPRTNSAPAPVPKQFSSDLVRQHSANDADSMRSRFDADAVTRSKLVSELTIVEELRNVPREVVWLVGPPSSGRSTLARYVCQLRGFTVNGVHATIDMDSVWRMVSERNHQDQIQSNNPLEEAQTLLETILKSESTNGLVIDGYLTEESHVDYVKEMFHYFRSVRPTVRFAFVLLDCTEEQITNRWRTKHNIPRSVRRSQQKSKELAAWRRTFQAGLDQFKNVRRRLMAQYDIQPINADHNLRAVQRDLEQELLRRPHGNVRSERFEESSQTPTSYSSQFTRNSYNSVHTPMSDGSYRMSHGGHIQHPHSHHQRRYGRPVSGGSSTPTSSMGSSPSRGDRHGRFKVQRSITHTVMAKITQRVRQRVIEMIYPRVPRHDSMRNSSLFHRLPAKFPVTMSQIRLDQIKRNDYWVSEKTDGVRYLMYIEKQHSQRRDRRRARMHDDEPTVEEFNCYLIDRKFFICRVCGDLYISGQDNDALLDGEFVTIEDDDGQEHPIFIVFDAVQVSHLNIAKNAYSVRHEHIRNLVNRIPLDQNEQFPLRITYKPLIEASRLQDVISQIHYDGQRRHKYVHNAESGLTTVNDGLMFMPEHSPYLPSEHDLPVVKWKWKELNTVDLMVRHPYYHNNELFLYCQGDGNNSVAFQTKPLPAAHNQVFESLVRQAAALRGGKNGKKNKDGPPSQFIVECVWDPDQGLWCPKWLRADKDVPNYIKVAKAINRDLSEFISPETLVKTLSREEVSQAVLDLGLRVC